MIPFHKWHAWVDEYLTEQYINSLYKSEYEQNLDKIAKLREEISKLE